MGPLVLQVFCHSGGTAMATYRRRVGKWNVQIRRKGWPDISKTFDRKADAEEWALDVEAKIAKGTWVDRAAIESNTLGHILKRYREEITPGKKGAVQEASQLRRLEAMKLAERGLHTLRSVDIAVLRDELLKTRKPGTVARTMGILSAVINHARREWGMEAMANPCEMVSKPAGHTLDARSRIVTPEEIALICAESDSPLLPEIVRFAAETGMRRGEIAGLEWRHVDMERRIARLLDTKNGEDRVVPLSTEAMRVLQLLGGERTGRVFLVEVEQYYPGVIRAVRRAGLKDVRFHDLRHTATTKLARVCDAATLAKVTGHKDTRMLLRYYHPDMAEVAKRLL